LTVFRGVCRDLYGGSVSLVLEDQEVIDVKGTNHA
jgi:hypothetical protein